MNGPDPAREAAILARCAVCGGGTEHGTLVQDLAGAWGHAMLLDCLASLKAQLTAARARAERAEGALAKAEEDGSSSWECLMMVSDALAAYIGTDTMKSVPPMFYPEAIQSLTHRAARAGILAVYRERALVPTQAEVGQLLRQARVLIIHQRGALAARGE